MAAAPLVDPFLNEDDYPSTNEFLKSNDHFSIYRSNFSKDRYDIWFYSDIKNLIPDGFTSNLCVCNTGFLCYLASAIENIYELFVDADTEENDERKYKKTIVLLESLQDRVVITGRTSHPDDWFHKFHNEEMSYGELLERMQKIKDFVCENGGDHYYSRPGNVLLTVGCYKLQNGFGGARTVRVGKYYPIICGTWKEYLKRRNLPCGEDADAVVINPFKKSWYELEWDTALVAFGEEKCLEYQEMVEGLHCNRIS